MPKFKNCDPAKVIQLFKKHNTTVLTGSPAFALRLAQYAINNHILLPIKYVGVGGAPVYHRTFRIIASATPNRMAGVVYGSTEAEPMTLLMADEKLELEASQPDGLCVGRAVLGAGLKVIKICDGEFGIDDHL